MLAEWQKHTTNKVQKDIGARWAQKNDKSHYGYKNKIAIDVRHKFIRRFDVTPAHMHDSPCFELLLDRKNSDPAVYADSSYRSDEHGRLLKRRRFTNRVHRLA